MLNGNDIDNRIWNKKLQHTCFLCNAWRNWMHRHRAKLPKSNGLSGWYGPSSRAWISGSLAYIEGSWCLAFLPPLVRSMARLGCAGLSGKQLSLPVKLLFVNKGKTKSAVKDGPSVFIAALWPRQAVAIVWILVIWMQMYHVGNSVGIDKFAKMKLLDGFNNSSSILPTMSGRIRKSTSTSASLMVLDLASRTSVS